MIRAAALLAPLLLAACASFRPGPTADPARCRAELAAAGARFAPVPDRPGPLPGCGLAGSVRLLDVGTPLGGLGPVSCPVALGLHRWLAALRPEAERAFGRRLLRVETFGSYACRPVNNAPGGRLSEHATANAVDIAAFRLAGGGRVSILADWRGPDPAARAFVRAAHRLACREFATALSPEYDAAHRDHLHLDQARGGLCR